MFNIEHLYWKEQTRGNHNCSDRKPIRVSQVSQVREDCYDDHSRYHQYPVDGGDIDLSLDGFRSVVHAYGRECFGVD